MNSELQRRLIDELSRRVAVWRTRQDHGSLGTVRWISVATLSDARLEIGLSSDGNWLSVTPGSVATCGHGRACLFLLPALELPHADVHRLLEDGLRANGLSTELAELFPFDDVVIEGLLSSSERWTGLALKWVEHVPLSDNVRNAVQAVVHEGPTQKLRHTARRVLRSATLPLRR
jgi:hypothetical protein